MGENRFQYQVTADCVYATVDTVTGKAKTLLYRGAFVSPDAPELRHLLDSKMVAKVGDDAGFGLNAEGGLGEATTPATGPTSVVSPSPLTAEDQETERKRAEARAKLPTDGSTPDGRASNEVWVEYAVSQGVDRTEAEKASKDDLRRMFAAK